MTSQPAISSPDPKAGEQAARSGFFANLPIGVKLGIGFGLLVVLTFLSAAVSYLGSYFATDKINRTDEVRVPAALKAAEAQADLLRMEASVRGYLALGDPVYRDQYARDAAAFEADLQELEKLSTGLGPLDQERVKQLIGLYEKWSALPEPLFALRDDQLEREPAYRLLATEGVRSAGKVLIDTSKLIQSQGEREPTPENLALLRDMAQFQGNFAAMLSALRGYVTTRNRIYRGEFEDNRTSNEVTWERLQDKQNQLTPNQLELLKAIGENRTAFLALPEQLFVILDGPRWREDLYLFQTEALPLTGYMNELLNDMVGNQQNLLTTELGAGRDNLNNTNNLILASGFIALTVALMMAFVLRYTVARPIVRLTDVAEQIRGGDLEAQARVESKDEIGTLASTFNNMTGQLRSTLTQVRKEKKRADDLLEVVIPIGVELTTERDFNRLLEKMLLEAKSFCRADTGILFLRTEQGTLQFTIVRSDSRELALGGTTGNPVPFSPLPLNDAQTGAPNSKHIVAHVASSGQSMNIADPEQASKFEVILDRDDPNQLFSGYQVRSLLSIPLKNSENQVLGVLELINPHDPTSGDIIAFDANLQQMMESFSSLAVAALEAYIREQSLRREIQQLRIEVDEAKRAKQVEEIVSTDFFQHISERAQELRSRHRPKT